MPQKRSALQELSPMERERFVARLKAVIAAAGSQTEAAKAAKLSVRQIGAYVAGTSAPQFFPLARLAAATGYDLNWLLTGDRSPKLAADSPLAAVALVRDAMDSYNGAKAELEFGNAVLAEIRPLYEEAGFAMNSTEESELAGAAIDSLLNEEERLRPAWRDYVGPIADAHRAAVRHIVKKRSSAATSK